MNAQTITLQTDDGQTLTLQVSSAVLGEPEAETPAETSAEGSVEEPMPMAGTTPMEKMKARRAAKMGY